MPQKNAKSRGFSLIELVIALAIFMILIGGVIPLIGGGPLSALADQKRLIAAVKITESWEALRAMRAGNWDQFQNGEHGLALTGNQWNFLGTQDQSDGVTRRVTVADVKRNPSGAVDPSGETDPDSKSVTLTLSWSPAEGQERSITLQTYLNHYREASAWPPSPPPEA